MTRKAKDNAAPKAKPRERKKAMMAPAVSASCWDTFLWDEHEELLDERQCLIRIQRTAGGTPSGDGVKSSETKTSWTCHISTESWDSCDFNYVF